MAHDRKLDLWKEINHKLRLNLNISNIFIKSADMITNLTRSEMKRIIKALDYLMREI